MHLCGRVKTEGTHRVHSPPLHEQKARSTRNNPLGPLERDQAFEFLSFIFISR
jgi:hypothetical protein